jgi:hypothetical protein
MTRRLDPLAIALDPLKGREVKRTTLRDAFPPEARAWPRESAEGAFIAMLSGAPALSVGPDHLVSVPTERLSDDSGPTYSVVTDTRARDEVALAIDSIPVENWCARATIIRMLVTARGRIPAAQQLGALMTWGEDPA